MTVVDGRRDDDDDDDDVVYVVYVVYVVDVVCRRPLPDSHVLVFHAVQIESEVVEPGRFSVDRPTDQPTRQTWLPIFPNFGEQQHCIHVVATA